jgi:hypothetical protein
MTGLNFFTGSPGEEFGEKIFFTRHPSSECIKTQGENENLGDGYPSSNSNTRQPGQIEALERKERRKGLFPSGN